MSHREDAGKMVNNAATSDVHLRRRWLPSSRHQPFDRVSCLAAKRVLAGPAQIATSPGHTKHVERVIAIESVAAARPTGAAEGEGQFEASGPGVKVALADPVNADLGA